MARVTAETVRSNFEREIHWTMAEAAAYAGLSPRTVANLWSRVSKEVGRRPWLPGLAIGALRVDAESFRKFVKTGEPQGAVVD